MTPSPGLIRMVLRRIRADWPVLAASALTLLLAGILVSSAPIYSRAVNDAGLQRSLNDAEITDANVEISGRFNIQNFPEADEYIRDEIASFYAIAGGEIFRMGRSDSFAFPDQDEVRDLTVFGFYDRISEHATILEGDWPETSDAPYQVAISRDTAEAQELSLGDALTLEYRHDHEYTVDVRIAGIYQVDDPNHPFWYDSELEMFGFTEGQSFDTYGPLVVRPEIFFSVATPRSSWVRWRLLPDFDSVTTTTAPQIRRETNRLINRIGDEEFLGVRMNVSTNLNSLIRRLERSLLVTQASVTIVVVQLAILAGYALVLTSRLIVDHRRVESAVLRARGASSRQLFGLALIEAIVLALPLILLAPPLAALALRAFNLAGPLADIELLIEPAISSGAYFSAGIAGLIGVLLLSIPVLRQQEAAPGAQASQHRQESESLWQRAGIDLAVLLVAAVGFFQLRRYSSTITETVEGRLGIDPLLVAAPALGLIAGAILTLRIVPLLARIAERVAARQRAALVALGAWQIARRPLVYSRSMLLLLLAIGIGIFTVAHTQTWQQSQVDQANYQIGADIRVQPDTRFSRMLEPIALTDAHFQIDGVVASMPVNQRLEQFGGVRDLGTLVMVDAEYAPDTILIRDDLEPDRFDQMVREMREARPEFDAAPLPGEPVRLSLRARIAPEFSDEAGIDLDEAAVQVAVTLLDGEGYLHRVNMGTVHPDEPDVDLAADLASDLGNGLVARPVYPLQIAAVEFSTIGAQIGENRGAIELSQWRVSDDVTGDGWRDVPAETLADPNWEASTHTFSGNTWAEMTLEPVDGTFVAGYATGSTPRVAVRRATFRISAPAPAVDGGVPVIISETLRDRGDYDIGDRILVPIGSFAFDGRVIGIVEGFPGTNAHTMAAVIADLPTIVAINERPAETPFAPSERWIALGGGDVDQVADTLEKAPYTSRRVAASDQRARELQRDPVALGTLGALSLGFFAATIVAGAGVIASSAGSARQRMGEFLLMRAIGLSPRQLSGWLLLENSLLIILGVIGGTLLGLMLGWLVLPLIALTQEARQVFPGVRVIIPWGTIGLLQGAGLALLAVLTGVLALIVRKGGLGESLRVRDD
jgi:hypothetical protein